METTEIKKKLHELCPNLKINAGYYIIDEAPGYAFGFNPKAPEALVLWSVDGDGDCRNGIYRNTLEGFGLRDLALCGLHVHQLNVVLTECGYDSMRQIMATEPPIISNYDAEQPESRENIRDKIDRMISETGEHPFVFRHDGKPIMVSFPSEAENYFTGKEMEEAREYILQSEAQAAGSELTHTNSEEEKQIGLSAALKSAEKVAAKVNHTKSLTQKLNELQR